MRKGIRSRVQVLGTLVSMALLAGCSTSPASQTQTDTGGTAVAVPDFSGPWADELAEAYTNATSDFERQALSDGIVTDAEYAEMEERYRACLGRKGIGFTGFNADGSHDFQAAKGMTAEAANKVADDCSATSGVNTVGMIRNFMRSNPQHLDMATIMASCLVKKGVVPRGYGADDYSRDAPAYSFPFLDKDAGRTALTTCSVDPLGLLGVEPQG